MGDGGALMVCWVCLVSAFPSVTTPPLNIPLPVPTTDDLIAESLRRNTHAKRHALPGRAAPLQPAAAAAGGAAGGGAGSNSDEGGWTVKGTKAARKEAQRRKRRGQRRAPAARGRGGEGSDGDEEEGDGEEEEGDEDGEEEEEAALRLGMEGLTTEGLLRSLSAHDAAAAPGGPSAATPGGPSAASPPPNQRAGAGASDGAAGGPVVVGLVGEPNVGKSSTLNALLGSHRVAVSSHPGRTKHYQTHYVSRRLVLCDCPGLVFPRLDVSLPMQVGARAPRLCAPARARERAPWVSLRSQRPAKLLRCSRAPTSLAAVRGDVSPPEVTGRVEHSPSIPLAPCFPLLQPPPPPRRPAGAVWLVPDRALPRPLRRRALPGRAHLAAPARRARPQAAAARR